MMQKTITLTANKAELTFEVTTDKYNKYINELSLSNKIAPAHNFLMRCVVEDSRPALKELLEQPGFAVQIASFVVEEFQPDLTLALGKYSGGRRNSKATTWGSLWPCVIAGSPVAKRTRTAWLRRFSLNSTTGKRWGLPWRTALQGHSGEPDGEAGKAHVQHWRP